MERSFRLACIDAVGVYTLQRACAVKVLLKLLGDDASSMCELQKMGSAQRSCRGCSPGMLAHCCCALAHIDEAQHVQPVALAWSPSEGPDVRGSRVL